MKLLWKKLKMRATDLYELNENEEFEKEENMKK